VIRADHNCARNGRGNRRPMISAPVHHRAPEPKGRRTFPDQTSKPTGRRRGFPGLSAQEDANAIVAQLEASQRRRRLQPGVNDANRSRPSSEPPSSLGAVPSKQDFIGSGACRIAPLVGLSPDCRCRSKTEHYCRVTSAQFSSVTDTSCSSPV